ncbi:Uncharacterized protein PBTT_03735 [Plasmodiophora brassicae]
MKQALRRCHFDLCVMGMTSRTAWPRVLGGWALAAGVVAAWCWADGTFRTTKVETMSDTEIADWNARIKAKYPQANVKVQ